MTDRMDDALVERLAEIEAVRRLWMLKGPPSGFDIRQAIRAILAALRATPNPADTL